MRIACVPIHFALAAACWAQTPSCNLIWEVNDGSGWTGTQLMTNQRVLNVRLRAEWDAPGGNSAFFSDAQFDGTIRSDYSGDSASTFSRYSPFIGFSIGYSHVITSYHFPGVIKIDSASDSLLPGQGSGWVEVFQSEESLPGPDISRTIPLFSYQLDLEDAAGTREISSVSVRRQGIETVLLATMGGAQYFVQPTTYSVRVTYLPNPATGGLFGIVATVFSTSRRRRTQLS